MSKIPKVVAGYIPAKLVAERGTNCGTCRDFIRSSSECVITIDPHVDGDHGTCTAYVKGQPHLYATALLLVPKRVVGYEEGISVPTSCQRCRYYEHPTKAYSTCAKVGDSDDDLVEAGGCCNGYEYKGQS